MALGSIWKFIAYSSSTDQVNLSIRQLVYMFIKHYVLVIITGILSLKKRWWVQDHFNIKCEQGDDKIIDF